MRAYFSFFPIMAVVIIGITLSQIYDLGLTLSQEGENSMMLVDRMYYLRKDSEYLFWKAALTEEETRMDAVRNWANASEMGQGAIQVSSWMGERHSLAAVFQGVFLPRNCHGTSCRRNITGETMDPFQVLLDSPSNCIHLSGEGIHAAGTSIYLENPRAASLFSATGGDYACPG